jgi:hypothetical protein
MPALGSFKFEMLNEGIKRKRSEKIAFARFIGKFLAPMSGLSQADVVRAVSEYAEELTQLSYNWTYETVNEKIRKVHESKEVDTEAILKKVAALSVD